MLREEFLSDDRPVLRALAGGALLLAFAGYVAVASFATLIYPAVLLVFLAPFALAVLAFAPSGRAAPIAAPQAMIIAAMALMPLWPTYIHFKLGPAPILTPPRLLFYAITACWAYDMLVSPLRRGQLFCAMRRGGWLAAFLLGFFALAALSVPLAEGTRYAAQEVFRWAIIWLAPMLALATYVRSMTMLRRVLAALALGAVIAALIALAEFATGVLLAVKLAPFIADDAVWLQITQELKSRDGVFRAQATHTHPLSLGEYLALGAPIALGFVCASRGRVRLLWMVAFALLVGGVLVTNARGAMIAMVFAVAATALVLAWRVLRQERFFRFRPLIGLACLAMLAASPVVVAGAHHVITGGAGESAARSSQARIDQIKKAWPKIVQRPVLGWGAGRAARIIGYWGRTLSVDNYYLSLAVDTGVPGPIVFLGVLVVVGRRSMRGDLAENNADRLLLIGVAGAMASFAVTRATLSQTGNLAFFFPLMGAYLGAAGRVAARRGRAVDQPSRAAQSRLR